MVFNCSGQVDVVLQAMYFLNEAQMRGVQVWRAVDMKRQ